MLVRATTKAYNQVVSEIITSLRDSDRLSAGDVIERYFATQPSDSRYWPDDVEVREALTTLPAYRRLGRSRLRMVLEAIEDHLRGWRQGKSGLGGERVARGAYAIEHVMPRKWQQHWPLQGGMSEADRDRLIHTIGNLTLLTGKLNSKVSNSPWLGEHCKREALQQHDVLILNRDLLNTAGSTWTDHTIRARTGRLIDVIVDIWRVPENHRSAFAHEKAVRHYKSIHLSDLISAGLLQPGMTLYPRSSKYAGRIATLLADARIDVNGVAYSRPTEAATALTGKKTSGWQFFLTDQDSRRSLRTVRSDYVRAMAVDAEDDEADDDGDEDEA
jgi:hypothetical protein